MDKVTLESVAPEFKSGNSIPVERATLTRQRMQEALDEYAAARVRETLAYATTLTAQGYEIGLAIDPGKGKS